MILVRQYFIMDRQKSKQRTANPGLTLAGFCRSFARLNYMTTGKLLNITILIFILTPVLYFINVYAGNYLAKRAYISTHGHNREPDCIPGLLGIFQFALYVLVPLIAGPGIVFGLIARTRYKNVKVDNLPFEALLATVASAIFAVLFFVLDVNIVTSLARDIITIYL